MSGPALGTSFSKMPRMQLLGELRNGDVHLKFPQLLVDQVTAVLALHRIGHGPLTAVGLWKEDDPDGNVSLLVLSSGDLVRVEKLFLQAFEDRAQPWMLVTPAWRTTGMRRFAWDIKPRPDEQAARPPLTRWFSSARDEVPTMLGVYEGSDNVALEPQNPSFSHWDGAAWGLPGRSVEAAHALAAGARGPAPRFWRGLAARPTA